MKLLHRDEEAARHINSAGEHPEPRCHATVTLTLTFDLNFVPDRWQDREQEALIRAQQMVTVPRPASSEDWSVEV